MRVMLTNNITLCKCLYSHILLIAIIYSDSQGKCILRMVINHKIKTVDDDDDDVETITPIEQTGI